jgi:hypothetical protein
MPMLGIMASAISGNLWAPAGAYDSISTATVTSGGTSSITFSSIPSTYTHLQLRILTFSASPSGDLRLQFNGDTGTTYSNHYLYGIGSGTPTSQGGANSTYIPAAFAGSTTQAGISVVDILDYTDTNKYKTVKSLGGLDVNGVGGYVLFSSGNWRNTTAITSATLFINGANLNQYSQISLYGIK